MSISCHHVWTANLRQSEHCTRQSALPLSLVKLPRIMSSAIPLCPTDNELAHGGKIDVKQKGEIVLKLSLSVAI